ncbi:DUF465 domain-containing protein [Helicobacter saguini]|uniref:DUF465 domain-containing protein n=1 Tax=Helicobacter saguini TaxID=1548018 RepID=A0A347VPH4_9HELI|nr:YdcH family protein [Helicobacter saguini]MWV61357.1 DUF465 domain-containing protein [Helicobacter saguini]MWV67973.1 DUF465 domain-containing protein [Helicobacter saguini]MWV70559.1 DUF465 domain-containing protein [Helicobacter saguini]MWV72463.1 DUF465 domain-containing protein [Helicobacter saguini]TLD94782.1 DUF465 domain-containing protein [Helicobacter saguini]
MFHEYREEITELKQHNAHFEKIFNEHNELDQQIKNAENGIEPLSNQEIEVLKKKKLLLKDEVYQMIVEYRKGHKK